MENLKILERWLRLSLVPNAKWQWIAETSQHLNLPVSMLYSINDDVLLNNDWSSAQIEVLKGKCKPSEALVSKALKWVQGGSDRKIITIESDVYPDALKRISSPPPVLFLTGNAGLLTKQILAIVGTRSPTLYANQCIEHILQSFENNRIFATVSGLALGVDYICHSVSLSHKIPTIAVLGSGIDVVYPKRHQSIYKQIAQSGLIISEFFPSTKPRPHFFPQRNRLISALSQAVLIVEGRIRSGTMSTVTHAVEQNKEVLAMPGSAFNPNTELSHLLIQQGASPVRDVADILAQVPSFVDAGDIDLNDEEKISVEMGNQDLATDHLLASVGDDATSIDVISQRSGKSVIDVLTTLIELEMRGLVASTVEGYVRLRR